MFICVSKVELRLSFHQSLYSTDTKNSTGIIMVDGLQPAVLSVFKRAFFLADVFMNFIRKIGYKALYG
jgi:hypothetical protein